MSDLATLADMAAVYPRPRPSWRARTRELLVAAASSTARSASAGERTGRNTCTTKPTT